MNSNGCLYGERRGGSFLSMGREDGVKTGVKSKANENLIQNSACLVQMV